MRTYARRQSQSYKTGRLTQISDGERLSLLHTTRSLVRAIRFEHRTQPPEITLVL